MRGGTGQGPRGEGDQEAGSEWGRAGVRGGQEGGGGGGGKGRFSGHAGIWIQDFRVILALMKRGGSDIPVCRYGRHSGGLVARRALGALY